MTAPDPLNRQRSLSTDDHVPLTPLKILSSGSQLQYRQRFLREALCDLLSSTEIAKRIFLQGIAQRYRYSSLGLFWAFMPSVMIAVLLTVGQRAQIPGLTRGAIPPQVYGIFGLIMMQTFLEAMQSQRMFLSRYSHLLIRQKIPVEGLILSGLAEANFAFIVRLPVIIAMFLFFNISPAATVLLSFLGFFTIIALGAGLGLFLAPWNVLSRDLESLMYFFPWLLFGVTPVFVAVQPKSWAYHLYWLNPLTHVLEATRWLAYGVGEISAFALLLFPLGILWLVSGWLFCRLCLPYIIERSLI
ncbi:MULTISPECIES: ABC transporter permease [unclassified Tolypothrix]|uniref:ABC transporter permease n=1 Tax=unclassified Tolypothrix TaxID=2649714 RepID=UPI0005EAAA51|nr:MULTISPECIES: ABC transporter permease [unclassified Tolypothrix]BAY92050.1 ABC-2 type transporter [Microchaete diplosiphon NIES-3275]EKF04754.1 ABC-2 type transporter [Tolypothrix sp. PCC 7601]MBE9081746.1 ABC transporter permease [Tolypothrix sp. LEGE 11397]UYD26036.1 ABC transporter permease [Tolypothrix sp. PCC 7712]UYD31725.1 ABC transporter permease [Tolypothrix sp. PCC 7601]